MKSKKKTLFVFIPVIVAVCAVVFVSLSAQKTKNEEVVIFKQGGQSDSVNKSEAYKSRLQNILEKTIDSLDEVRNSSVTIDSGKGSQPSASVVINLPSNKSLTLAQQASIKKLVKNSVQNLSEDNIHLSITKDAG